jgi:hypothetical protein
VLGVIMLIVVTYKPTGIMGFILSNRERIGAFGRPAKRVATADPAQAAPAKESPHGAS